MEEEKHKETTVNEKVDENEFGGELIEINGKEFFQKEFHLDKQTFTSLQKDKSKKFDENNDQSNDDKNDSDMSISQKDELEIPWMTIRTQVDDPWVQLHNEIIEFYKIYGPNRESKKIRKKLFNKTKRTIKAIFPGSLVKMFGSTAAMLYLPKSDIDIVVFVPKQTLNEHKSSKKLYKYINKISWIKSCQQIGAKVPIVKLEDEESGLFVDISFSKSNGVAALSFIKKYLVLYPELKYLLIIIKAFLKSRDLNETFHGGMSSFTCTLLIISYLQEIKKDAKNGKNLLLSQHLINFFHLYGIKFNYNEIGISIRNGGYYFLRQEKNWLAASKTKSVTL